MGSKTITNPAGAFGYTDLNTKLPQTVDSFVASAAITSPSTGRKVVSVNTEGKVATSATDGVAALAVGVAFDTVVSGDVAQVITAGIAENVLAQGTIAAGDSLIRSGTTAGYVAASATPVAGTVIGVALNASSGGTVDVWLH
jgi:hypothetical protein